MTLNIADAFVATHRRPVRCACRFDGFMLLPQRSPTNFTLALYRLLWHLSEVVVVYKTCSLLFTMFAGCVDVVDYFGAGGC